MSGREGEQPATPEAQTGNAHTAPAPVGVARFWPVISGAAELALVVMLALGIVIAVDTWRTVRVGTPSEVDASEATREEDGSVG